MSIEAADGENQGGAGIGAAGDGAGVHTGADTCFGADKGGADRLYGQRRAAGGGHRPVQHGGGSCHDPHGQPSWCGAFPETEAGAAAGGVLPAGNAHYRGGAGFAGAGETGQRRDERHRTDLCRGRGSWGLSAGRRAENRFPQIPFPDSHAFLYAAVRSGPTAGGSRRGESAAPGLRFRRCDHRADHRALYHGHGRGHCQHPG